MSDAKLRWVAAKNLDNERRYRNFFVAFSSWPAVEIRATLEASLPSVLRHEVRWSERAMTLWCSTDEWPEGCDDDDVWDQLLVEMRAWVRALPTTLFVFSFDELSPFTLQRADLRPIIEHLTTLFREQRVEAGDLVLVDNLAYFIARRAVEDVTDATLMAAVVNLAHAVAAANSQVGPALWKSEVLAVINRV